MFNNKATRLEVAGESEHAALKPSRRKTKRGGAKQKKAAMNAVQEVSVSNLYIWFSLAWNSVSIILLTSQFVLWKVHISKIKRKARKYVTTVFGLETFGT